MMNAIFLYVKDIYIIGIYYLLEKPFNNKRLPIAIKMQTNIDISLPTNKSIVLVSNPLCSNVLLYALS